MIKSKYNLNKYKSFCMHKCTMRPFVIVNFFQNQLCKELVQPVFKACVEMWESKDDKIQSSVDQILTGMKGGHVAELDEDGHVIDTIIRRYLTGDEPGLIGKSFSVHVG